MNELQALRNLRELSPSVELDAQALDGMLEIERSNARSLDPSAPSRRVEDIAFAVLVGALVAYVAPIAMQMLLRLAGAAG